MCFTLCACVTFGVLLSLFTYAVQELSELQNKHSTRPDVFDDVEEEHAVDVLTAEITQVSWGWAPCSP